MFPADYRLAVAAEARRWTKHPIHPEEAWRLLVNFGLFTPPLERADVLGLAIFARLIDHVPPGPVTTDTVTHAAVRAIYGYAAAAPWAFEAAGWSLPAVPADIASLDPWKTWANELGDTRRCGVRYDVARGLLRRQILPLPRDDEALRALAPVARKLGREPEELFNAAWADPPAYGLFRRADGTFGVDGRHLLDRYRDQRGGRTRSKLGPLDAAPPTGAEPGGEDPGFALVEQRDALEAVRAAIEARRQQPGRSKALAAVREHAEKLLAGELSLRELGRETGLDHRALGRAWQAELEELRRILRAG